MSVNSINDIWAAVLEVLGPQLTPTAMATWFSDCVPIEIEGTDFVVHTSSDFKRNIINVRFKSGIEAAADDFLVNAVLGDFLEADLQEPRRDVKFRGDRVGSQVVAEPLADDLLGGGDDAPGTAKVAG